MLGDFEEALFADALNATGEQEKVELRVGHGLVLCRGGWFGFCVHMWALRSFDFLAHADRVAAFGAVAAHVFSLFLSRIQRMQCPLSLRMAQCKFLQGLFG